MAFDNVIANPGSGGATFRAFFDGTADWPGSVASYITGGSAGAWTVQQVDTTHGLPVSVLGTVPVSGTFWQATQPVSIAATVNVAVASALPAGANVIGGVTQSGSWSVSIGAALPAGSNLIGGVQLIDSGGANKASISAAGAVKVDGSAVTQPVSGTVTANAGTGTFNVSGTVTANAGTGPFVVSQATASNLNATVTGTVTANAGTGNFTVVQATASNLNATVTGSVNSTPQAGTSGGATPYHYLAAGAANQDSTIVKASAGQVYSVAGFNTNSTPVYLKLYDKATGPVSTDTPIHTLLLPGNTNGAGMILPLPVGMAFSTGISFRITGGMADSDATAVASGAVIDITYK